MDRITLLTEKVRELYEMPNSGKADWADWLYENHVLRVAEKAREFAERFGADPEIAAAAGILHDIADTTMKRSDQKHEAESLRIARDLLGETGFTDQEIRIIVDDALRFHSCYGNERPETIEGKVMAAADAVVHITTDFYGFALEQVLKGNTKDEAQDWVLAKLDRDFNNKIYLDVIRDEIRTDYKKLKTRFSCHDC